MKLKEKISCRTNQIIGANFGHGINFGLSDNEFFKEKRIGVFYIGLIKEISFTIARHIFLHVCLLFYKKNYKPNQQGIVFMIRETQFARYVLIDRISKQCATLILSARKLMLKQNTLQLLHLPLAMSFLQLQVTYVNRDLVLSLR